MCLLSVNKQTFPIEYTYLLSMEYHNHKMFFELLHGITPITRVEGFFGVQLLLSHHYFLPLMSTMRTQMDLNFENLAHILSSRMRGVSPPVAVCLMTVAAIWHTRAILSKM